jgi:hemerythrin superfamily protein
MATPATLSATQLLRQRHKEIEDMFKRTLAAPAGTERAELWDCLRATLAVHETTEEMFLHPLARSYGDDAVRIVEARLAEESEAKHVLAELEDLGPDGDQFATKLTLFQRAVIEHAEKEEHELFPIVDENCPQDDLKHLADAILAGEQLAPTHSHPHAGENPIVLMLVGPFASMVDKARDHFTQWTRSRAENN